MSTSVLYPVRVEDGSTLDGAGSGGSDIGPTILKQIGISGTLYGETGYDTITNVDLFPFPNESKIKTQMSSYTNNWPEGNLPNPARGFCADGKQLNGVDDITLTSYIWEYLGNEMPDDIYGTITPATTYRGNCFAAHYVTNRFENACDAAALRTDCTLENDLNELQDYSGAYNLIADDYYIRESRYIQDQQKYIDYLKLIGWGLFTAFAYSDAKEHNTLFLNACTVGGFAGFVIKFGDIKRKGE
jgi:hypothetical protein